MSERQGIISSDFSSSGDANTSRYPVAFDNIINVKLFRGSLDKLGVAESDFSSQYVTIHSDYDALLSETNPTTVAFVRCIQKPSISVNFKMYGQGISPKMVLKIVNFNADTTGTLMSDLRADATPFKSVEIHIGYINMMHNWEKDTTVGTDAYKRYCALEGDSSSVTVIKGDILFARITKNPPDSEIEFELIPATAYSGVPDVRNYLPSAYLCKTGYAMVNDLLKALTTYKEAYVKDYWSISDFTNISKDAPTFTEVFFYWLISRRFWKDSVSASYFYKTMQQQLQEVYDITDSDGSIAVSDLNTLQEALGSDTATAEKLSFLPDKPTYLQKVLIGTQELRYLLPAGVRDLLVENDEDSLRLLLAGFIGIYAPSLQATLVKIKNEVFPTLTWKDGFTQYKGAGQGIAGMNALGKSDSAEYSCICLYSEDNKRDSASFMAIAAGVNVSELNAAALEAYAYSLPVIYSVTEGAVSTCHMPFCGMFPLIYPLKFNRAFMLTDNTSYYLPTANGKSYFYCFAMEVDFSTVGNNETVLSMVAIGDTI